MSLLLKSTNPTVLSSRRYRVAALSYGLGGVVLGASLVFGPLNLGASLWFAIVPAIAALVVAAAIVIRAQPSAEIVSSEDIDAAPYSPEVQALLAEINDIGTASQRRLEIGDRLAELGDPRPGVGVNADELPDIAWVNIPAGKFLYGDARQTETVEAFSISKYPVTNRQFQCFVDAGGYDDARLVARSGAERPLFVDG